MGKVKLYLQQDPQGVAFAICEGKHQGKKIVFSDVKDDSLFRFLIAWHNETDVFIEEWVLDRPDTQQMMQQ